jgi:hypothetical protein
MFERMKYMRLLTTTLAFALTAPLFAAELGNPSSVAKSPVVAHEWGTFTSVAGADGDPVRWDALTGPPELPCFVRVGPVYKTLISDLVRMETPVLYFYSARPAKLSVDVQFPLGKITEWYPDASNVSNAAGGPHLHYDSVELMPGPDPAFPTAKGQSRYFAARNTDATPLKIGSQVEKMIFYRGVGGFAIPLRPKFTDDGKIQIRNVSQDRIPLVIVFENRGGKVGYRIQTDVQETVIEPPLLNGAELNGAAAAVKDAIVKALIARGGLYPKEAQAMLDTWQDSWFEEGMRVIYILPQRQVDAVLPLTIQPAPAETTRAFVGRIEMLSPGMKQSMETAMASGDTVTLERFGRFLGAFAPPVEGGSNAVYGKAVANVQSNFNSGGCVP